MNAAETGTLWGLIVALIPGYRIKLGKPTLNKRQKSHPGIYLLLACNYSRVCWYAAYLAVSYSGMCSPVQKILPLRFRYHF